MKKLQFLSFLLFSILFFACSSATEDIPNVESDELTSIQDVLDLKLDEKFEIPEKIYQKFIKSLIFKDNRFSGCYYLEVDNLFEGTTSKDFWKNFGIQVRSEYQGKESRSGCSTDFTEIPTPHGCTYKFGHMCCYD